MPALKDLTTKIQETSSISPSSVSLLFQEAHQLKNFVQSNVTLNPDLNHEINTLFKALSRHSPCFHFNSIKYVDQHSLLPETYFKEKTEEVINQLVEAFQKAVEECTLNSYFDLMIQTLGKNRQEIAIAQNSRYAEDFGSPRYNTTTPPNDLSTPILHNNAYKEYHHSFIQNLLLVYKNNKEDIIENENISIIGNSTNGYNSEFNIQKIDKAYLTNCYANPDISSAFDQKILSSLIDIDDCFFNSVKSNSVSACPKILKDPKSTLVYASMEIQKQGKIIPLSSYFIFVDNECLEKEEITSETKSPVVIIHQDPTLFKDSLKELKSCFIDCIDSTNEKELKENVAIFRYLFAHIAPYYRGSAWAAECAEKAIYRYKGYEFSYGEDPSSNRHPLGDLDALTDFSLSDFMTDYLSKAQLIKISKTSSTPREGAV